MARLDTGWHNNPKVLRLSDKGMALHAWSISYCDAARSDGFIAQDAWPARFRQAVSELERSGMWERCPGGYYLHDYLQYNRSRARIDDYMRAKREAGRAGGLAKALARASPDATADATASALANGQQMLKQKATPGPGVRELTTSSSVGLSPGLSARARPTDDDKNLENLPDEVRATLSRQPLRPVAS